MSYDSKFFFFFNLFIYFISVNGPKKIHELSHVHKFQMAWYLIDKWIIAQVELKMGHPKHVVDRVK